MQDRIEEQRDGSDAASYGLDDGFDEVVDMVIEAAGGDLRAAIAGLARGQHAIEHEKAKTVSAGYVRRGLSTIKS